MSSPPIHPYLHHPSVSTSSQPSFHPHRCPSLQPSLAPPSPPSIHPSIHAPRGWNLEQNLSPHQPPSPFPGVAEMEKLKDVFSRIIFSLEQKGMAKVPYQVAVPEAVAQIQPELAQLKPAPACVPPCGYQKDAQAYKCASCSRVECQLPLDCPVEDVWKDEGERTTLTCRVPFQTPPDVRHSWKFVKDLRTRDLSLFRDLHPGASSSIVLRPTWGSHRGTYACQLAQEDDVLARNYFYLNVTASSRGAETELQDMFRAVLQSPAGRGAQERLPGLSELLAEPDSLHKRNVVLLMVGLALSALLGTLLLGGVCRWAMGRA
ncbi:sperm acrosome membrane-associated protein 6 [Pangshura tecta]